MRALTLIQPMAWALFHGKDVENRDWEPPVKLGVEPFCVHGGKSYDRDYEEFIKEILGLERLPAEAHAAGVLGVVTVDRVIKGGRANGSPGPAQVRVGDRWQRANTLLEKAFLSPWYVGKFGWCIADRIEFPAPIPCRGMLGMWPLPDVVEAHVKAYLESGHAEWVRRRAEVAGQLEVKR